ncbi:hypothetical protein [Emticicia sp. W12TSBA100-4]|uniref:hypothetical protein n=1 Tax=Emticicia sp. W12TSBA100-4 TaxID=3160965 RepID=UPI003305DD85
MKKLFKKPSFWFILLTIIGLIIARIIQVRNNLKKKANTFGADLSTSAITKAFFTEPIFVANQVSSNVNIPLKVNVIDPTQTVAQSIGNVTNKVFMGIEDV